MSFSTSAAPEKPVKVNGEWTQRSNIEKAARKTIMRLQRDCSRSTTIIGIPSQC